MSTAVSPQPDRRYLKLIRQFPLRPIRTKRDLGQALKIAHRLATCDDGTLPHGEQNALGGRAMLRRVSTTR